MRSVGDDHLDRAETTCIGAGLPAATVRGSSFRRRTTASATKTGTTPWPYAPIAKPRGVLDFELLGGQRPVAVVRLERREDVIALHVPQWTYVL